MMKPKLFATVVEGGMLELAVKEEHRALLQGTAQWLGDEWQIEPFDSDEENLAESGFLSELYDLSEQDDPEMMISRILVDLMSAMFEDGPRHFALEVSR